MKTLGLFTSANVGILVEKMGQVQFSSTSYEFGYQFDVHIRKVRWLPLFADQWLVPRFVVKVTNKGKDINKGELSCEFVEHDEVSSFPSVKTNFKDFQHFPLKDFKKGDTLKFNIKVESRFVKPARYMLRFLINEWEPASSPYNELRGQLKKIYHDDKKIESLIQEISKIVTLPKEPSPNVFKGVPLLDWRWLEVIKVHPVSTVIVLIGTAAALIGAAIGLVKLLV